MAWTDKDVEKLLRIFHPDIVWLWPQTSKSHDPIEWVFGMGRFNHKRWKKSYSDLFFESHRLIHNVREIRKIVISDEGDGAFAVVDVDTVCMAQHKHKRRFPLEGKSMQKTYTKMPDDSWKLIANTGLLDYGNKPI